jgi:hypothetical protein
LTNTCPSFNSICFETTAYAWMPCSSRIYTDSFHSLSPAQFAFAYWSHSPRSHSLSAFSTPATATITFPVYWAEYVRASSSSLHAPTSRICPVLSSHLES